MSNLTITIDDTVLKKARMRALEEGTSVNAELRRYLVAYSGNTKDYSQIADDILAFSRKHPCNSQGKKWTRDEIYDRWEQHHK
jgi:plasmid stability protein